MEKNPQNDDGSGTRLRVYERVDELCTSSVYFFAVNRRFTRVNIHKLNHQPIFVSECYFSQPEHSIPPILLTNRLAIILQTRMLLEILVISNNELLKKYQTTSGTWRLKIIAIFYLSISSRRVYRNFSEISLQSPLM